MALGLFDYEKVNNRLIKALQEEPALQDLLQTITYRKVRCMFRKFKFPPFKLVFLYDIFRQPVLNFHLIFEYHSLSPSNYRASPIRPLKHFP
jgi:hypothetical protein